MAALSLRSSLGVSLSHQRSSPKINTIGTIHGLGIFWGCEGDKAGDGHRCCFPNILYASRQLKEKIQWNYTDRGLSKSVKPHNTNFKLGSGYLLNLMGYHKHLRVGLMNMSIAADEIYRCNLHPGHLALAHLLIAVNISHAAGSTESWRV